jgi:hypothetical protein
VKTALPILLTITSCCVLGLFTTTTAPAQDPFAGFENHGLVGVGRVPANSFDRVGPHNDQDTLGGFFSSMVFDQSTTRLTKSKNKGKSYGGTLYALPDRGLAMACRTTSRGFRNFASRLHRIMGPVLRRKIKSN